MKANAWQPDFIFATEYQCEIKMGTVHDERFCLRWNDFESNISNSFRELRDDKDFFDVTLACDDNQLQAHKVILSACSPFFRSVLKKNPHQHPLLYLKGVKYENILSVLNFMYHGEVNVAHEDLNSFLAVAEDLQVKGLTQSNTNKHKNTIQEPNTLKRSQDYITPVQKVSKLQRTTTSVQKKPPIQSSPVQIKTETPASVEFEEETISNNMEIVNEYQTNNSGYEDYGQSYEVEESYEEDFEQDQGQLDINRSTWDNTWSSKQFSCDVCFKTFSNKKSLQNHAGSHTGKTTCSVCQKIFSTSTNLNQHMRNAHPTNLNY